MEYIKNGVKRAVLGGPLGVFIGQIILIMIILNGEIDFVSGNEIIRQFVICIIVGGYFSSISVIYEVEEWSLLKQTIIHGILNIPFFPLGIYAGWIQNEPIKILIYIVIYILIYIIIWTGIKSYWKSKTNEINKKIRNGEL